MPDKAVPCADDPTFALNITDNGPSQGPIPDATAQKSRCDTITEEVAACLPAFSVIADQLKQSIAIVEDATVRVGNDFGGIVECAQQVINQSTGAIDGDPDTSVAELVAECRKTLDTLLGRIDGDSQRSLHVATQIAGLADAFKSIQRCLSDIDDMADYARVVAMNGRIEAARSGAGENAAFGVVAMETTELAKIAKSTAESIHGIVANLQTTLHETAETLRGQAEHDLQASNATRSNIIHTLNRLEAMNHQLHETLQSNTELGNQLASDISRCVMAMQFQDSVSQQVEHLVCTLTEISEALEPHVSMIAPPQDNDNPWLKKLVSRYTMDSERQLHQATLSRNVQGTDPTSKHPTPSDLGDNVELF